MLEPESRLLLLDALRPPSGYAFDRAVGTTFTLDLVALLITPVAFALFDVESEEGRIAANPVAVLESVRRFADRITVFTQAGQIKVPAAFRAAYAYLGLDWTYEAVDCDAAGLAALVAALTPDWAGLSLTMPLKEVALAWDSQTGQLRLADWRGKNVYEARLDATYALLRALRAEPPPLG